MQPHIDKGYKGYKGIGPVLMPLSSAHRVLPRAHGRCGSAAAQRLATRFRARRSNTSTRTGECSGPHSRPGRAAHHSRHIPMSLQRAALV
jgi:hypothetical protein